MPLTDTAIRTAKPSGKIQKLSDGEGLQLWVMPTGSKLWCLAYRDVNRNQRKLSLGAYPGLTLAAARKKKDEAKALLASGVDPGQQKKLDKAAKALSDATTFDAIANEYLGHQEKSGRAATTLKKLAWLLAYARPVIGKRAISDIRSMEVLAVARRVEAKGTYETARRLKETVGAVFRYAIATGRANADPTYALKGALVAPKVQHRPAITNPTEFGALLRSIDAYDGHPVIRLALRLLPLVFTRPGELRWAEWREFDLERGLWVVPAGRMKMRREHQVALSRQALAILAELNTLTGRGALLFPSVVSSQRPISENTFNAAFRRMGYDKDVVTAHGFRATASTLLNESGKFSPDAIERSLAHQDPDEIRRAYARGAYWDERVRMSQWWADYLEELKVR